MTTVQHTEGSIIKELRMYFQNGYNYRVDNAFIFAPDWESDFFCTNREGYAFEFEVKISRSDFKADLKKKKHQIFTNGYYTQFHTNNGVEVSKHIKKSFIPNRFYYAVPHGLITKEEVPEYAGLITVGNSLSIVKRAPFIHRNKLDFRKVLCDKFYYRWTDQLRANNIAKYEMENLRKRIENLKKRYPHEVI